jgi:hypothetical protein
MAFVDTYRATGGCCCILSFFSLIPWPCCALHAEPQLVGAGLLPALLLAPSVQLH